MVSTLQGYVAHLQSLLHGAIAYVEQNQFTFSIVAALVVVLAFASWLNGVWKRVQARRELTNNEMIAYHLDRIASSLERLARLQHSGVELSHHVTAEPNGAETEPPRQVGVGSMFGFSSGMTLANPMYRPR